VDITDRKRAEEQRDLLVAELSHRVKNTLAIVISIAQQSFSRNPNVQEARRSFDSRIRALAQTHNRLAETNWSGVSFQALLLDELAPYFREDGSNVRVSGPPVQFHAKGALTLGMALHELATNAAKHGALSSKCGSVDVAWHVGRPLGQAALDSLDRDRRSDRDAARTQRVWTAPARAGAGFGSGRRRAAGFRRGRPEMRHYHTAG
jgi:two-component sensor histidine kinase